MDAGYEVGSFSRPFASGAGRRVEAGHQTPQGFPAAAEMLAMMYDASLDRIYSRNQSLSVYYNRYILITIGISVITTERVMLLTSR